MSDDPTSADHPESQDHPDSRATLTSVGISAPDALGSGRRGEEVSASPTRPDPRPGDSRRTDPAGMDWADRDPTGRNPHELRRAAPAPISPPRLRFGVLGTGAIAAHFATQVLAAGHHQVTAVASRDAGRAAEFAGRFGIGHHYGHYDQMLADDEVDAVYVALPHPLHATWSIRAAEAGRHVLCEKPLALNHAEAMAIVDAARRNDVALLEAFMYRFHPQTSRLVDLIAEGAVGRVMHIEASFGFVGRDREGRLFAPELGGGGILDVGCYPMSMARLLAGAAGGGGVAEPEGLEGGGRLSPDGVDLWAVATLRFPGALTATLLTGVDLEAPNRVVVSGTDGYLVVPNPWTPPADAPGRIELHRVGYPPETVTTPAVPAYAAEADGLARHLADRQVPEMTWQDSLGNMAALDRWRRAVGVVYPSERPGTTPAPLDGRPLRRRATAVMPEGRIPGVRRSFSRLVLGVDNQRDPTEAAVVFDAFFASGGNAFDTAWIYGHGRQEVLLGNWIRSRGVRDEVVIVAKGAHTPHCDPAAVARQLSETLERLTTDAVDLYLLHRDNPAIEVGEFVDALDAEVRTGRTAAVGVSNWTPARVDAANAYARREQKAPLVALSNHFSLATPLALPWEGCEAARDDATRAWLADRGLALLPWSSQARGYFAFRDRTAPGPMAEEIRRCFGSPENALRRERAVAFGERRGVSATAVALAWVLAQPFATFPLVGPRTLAELADSLDALTLELESADLAWLDGVSPPPG